MRRRQVGGKAGASLAAFVQLIDAMRAATAGLPLPEAVEHVNRGVAASSRTTSNEKDGQDRLDNLEELVNAADGFVREADLAVDAPMRTGDVDADASRRRKARRIR